VADLVSRGEVGTESEVVVIERNEGCDGSDELDYEAGEDDEVCESRDEGGGK